jgi:transposase
MSFMRRSASSCLVGMEACSGAHFIGRQLAALGHDVRLIPAQYVKPFLKGHKNDYRDAEAIAEAVQRPTMHFVGDQDAGADGPAGSASRALASR